MMALPSKPTQVLFLPDRRGVNALTGTIGKYLGKKSFLVAIFRAYTFPNPHVQSFKNGLFWAIPWKGQSMKAAFQRALYSTHLNWRHASHVKQGPSMMKSKSPTSPTCQRSIFSSNLTIHGTHSELMFQQTFGHIKLPTSHPRYKRLPQPNPASSKVHVHRL